eukprot:scaffold41010_cov42-Prasinocladus_malaysianus.AAC.1
MPWCILSPMIDSQDGKHLVTDGLHDQIPRCSYEGRPIQNHHAIISELVKVLWNDLLGHQARHDPHGVE